MTTTAQKNKTLVSHFLVQTWWHYTGKFPWKLQKQQGEKEGKKEKRNSFLVNLGEQTNMWKLQVSESRTEIKQSRQRPHWDGPESPDTQGGMGWGQQWQNPESNRPACHPKERDWLAHELCPSSHSCQAAGHQALAQKASHTRSALKRRTHGHKEKHPGALCEKDYLLGKNLEVTLVPNFPKRTQENPVPLSSKV